MRRVTLFWPPIPNGQPEFRLYPSLGMAYLDAVLRDNGFEVSVVDANIVHDNTAEFYDFYNAEKYGAEKGKKVWQSILEELVLETERTDPDILGVGSWSYNMPFVAEFTRAFKSRNPDIPTIVGGHTSTHLPSEVLELMPEVDFLVRGEGEYTMLELCKKIADGKSPAGVEGVSCRNGEGKIVHMPPRGYIQDLDDLPLMDYEDFVGMDKWLKKGKMEFIQVMTTRGCIAGCSFCSVHALWKAQRFYSNSYVLRQIAHLDGIYDYKNDIVAFMDDNFVAKADITKKLIREFKESYPTHKWQIVDMRVDMLTDDILDYFGKNGCEFVGIGLESINSESLSFFNKTVSPAEYVKRVFGILAHMEKLDMHCMASGIIGAPNETREDMLKQANFYIRIFNEYPQTYFDVAPLLAPPGTRLWSEYVAGKIGLYRRPVGSAKRFWEGLFAEKYDHLPWMVPNAYRVPNKMMHRDEYERLLHELVDETLNPLARAGQARLPRDNVDYVGVQKC